jgi:hypothetical protein
MFFSAGVAIVADESIASIAICPLCGMPVRTERLNRHLNKKCPKRPNRIIEQIDELLALVPDFLPLNPISSLHEIVLYSTQSIKMESDWPCDHCGVIARVLWNYSKTNYGSIHLCSLCRYDLGRNNVYIYIGSV